MSGTLYIARRAKRRALYIPMAGVKADPSLLFLMDKTDKNELDDLVRAVLTKRGITTESQVQKLVTEAEIQSENRIKVAEARMELRRLMKERAEGKALMQRGFRKWAVAYYPAVRQYVKQEV